MKRVKYFTQTLIFLSLLLMPLQVMAKSDSTKKVVGTVTEAGTTIVRSEDKSQNNGAKKVETKKNETKKNETKTVEVKNETPKITVEKTKSVAGKNTSVLHKATVSLEDDAEDDEDDIVIEATDSDVAQTAAVDENSTNLENHVIDSMLKNDFPEKSEFIADEDKKSGVILGKNDSSSLNTAAPHLKEEVGLGGMIANTVVMTIVLVLLIVGMAYVWRYLHGKSFGKMLGKSGELKIVTEQIISPKSKLMVIDCYGKKYLVGATENNIQMLADIDLDAVVTAESVATEDEAPASDAPEESNYEDSNDDLVTNVGFAQNILSQFSAKKEANLATTSGKMFVPLSQIAEVETKHTKTLKTSERIKERLKDMKRLA